MISISNLGKHFGQQTLFAGGSLQFVAGTRYGIVGANGSGKSTLLKMLAGDEIPSEGTISIPKKLRLGVLKQDHFQYENDPILDVVMMGNQELWSAWAEREELLENADEEFDADRFSELEDVIQRFDGYTLEARAGEILEGLGIETEVHRQPLSTLSGGFKLRVLLAQTLAAEPDALLLDEPTNHLDILSIRWLEKFLVEFKGCSIVVSHDHRFLDNVCTSILDVDYETLTLYPGNYTAFEKRKVEDRERKEHEIKKREQQIADHQAFVDRFKAKATKARQAQSKMKLIERTVIDRLPTSSRRYPAFRFQSRRPPGKIVLEAEGLSKSYGENQVLEDVSLEVRRGERVAVIGPNGIGKSTLLKIVMGQVDADGGESNWGYEAHPGYFAQDHKEQLGDGKQSIEAWLWDHCPGEPIGFVRGHLGAVLFSGDEVKKRLGSLSGGEAARLVFAQQVVLKPNILVLDEPTNHLDLEAIRALVDALRSYDGTLIFVSHDRWFVSELANRIVEITPQGITDFVGTYEEYLAACGDDHLDSDVVLRKAREHKKKTSKATAPPSRELKRNSRKLERELEEVTSEVETAEARIAEINELFCDPKFFEPANQKKVRKLEAEQKELKERTDELMARWQDVEEQLEELKALAQL